MIRCEVKKDGITKLYAGEGKFVPYDEYREGEIVVVTQYVMVGYDLYCVCVHKNGNHNLISADELRAKID